MAYGINVPYLTSGNSLSGSNYYYSVAPAAMPQSLFGAEVALPQWTLYLTSIDVDRNFTCAHVGFMNGSFINSGGAHAVVITLFTNNGLPIGRTSSVGTGQSGLNAWQDVALNDSARLTKGRYFFGIMSTGGVTSRIRTIAAGITTAGLLTSTIANYESATPTANASIYYAVPSTFVADVGPVAYLRN